MLYSLSFFYYTVVIIELVVVYVNIIVLNDTKDNAFKHTWFENHKVN